MTSFLLVVGVFGRRERNQLVLGRSVEPWVTNAFAVLAGTIVVGAGATFVTRSAFAGRYAAVFFPIFVVLVASGAGPSRAQLGAHGCGRVDRAVLADRGVRPDPLAGSHPGGTDRGGDQRGRRRPATLSWCVPINSGPRSNAGCATTSWCSRTPTSPDPRFVDWVDYEDRYRDVDPAAVAQRRRRSHPGRLLASGSSSPVPIESSKCSATGSSKRSRNCARATHKCCHPTAAAISSPHRCAGSTRSPEAGARPTRRIDCDLRRADAHQTHAPAVDDPPVGSNLEERGERTFLLVGVRALDQLDLAVLAYQCVTGHSLRSAGGRSGPVDDHGRRYGRGCVGLEDNMWILWLMWWIVGG